MEEIVGEPILLVAALKKALEEADSFKQDCTEVSDKVEKLANLLRTSARLFSHGSENLYDRPARRIMLDMSKTLEKALVLIKKCKRSGVLKRVMNNISASDFNKVHSSLEGAIGDVTWLLNASTHSHDGKQGGMEGLPPIASTDPMLAWVWGQVALVHGGNPEEKEEGASYLTSLASDNDRNRKIIIEEGGVAPLLRLLKEETALGGRLAAASALGALAANQERVWQILNHGAIQVFVHILQDGPMKLQAKVAWVVAKMVSQAPEVQNAFSSESIIRPLVSLLVFETMDISPHKTMRSNTMQSLARGTNSPPILDGKAGWAHMKTIKSDNGRLEDQWDARSTYSELSFDRRPWGSPDTRITKEAKPARQIRHSRGFSDSYYFRGFSSRELLKKERENEEPETKTELKVQVTLALWKLAENNVTSSRKITDTKALVCFAKLIEKEKAGEVQKNAVMAVLEIAGAAERDVELRRFAFKTNSPAAKAVVDQLLRIIKTGECDLQVPCLKAVGCLSRTFPARETKVIELLVHQLSHTEVAVVGEAVLALQKFAQAANFLHLEHSKTIVDAGAVPYLRCLLSMDEKDVQVPAIILLCHLAINAGDSKVFREAASLKMLKTAARSANLLQVQSVNELLPKAIHHLELYQATHPNY